MASEFGLGSLGSDSDPFLKSERCMNAPGPRKCRGSRTVGRCPVNVRGGFERRGFLALQRGMDVRKEGNIVQALPKPSCLPSICWKAHFLQSADPAISFLWSESFRAWATPQPRRRSARATATFGARRA